MQLNPHLVILKNGGIGVLRSEQATINQSGVAIAIAETITAKESRAGIVITRDIRSDTIRTGILLAGKIDGNVETFLDTPRAMLAGLTAGTAVGLVLWVSRLISGRKK